MMNVCGEEERFADFKDNRTSLIYFLVNQNEHVAESHLAQSNTQGRGKIRSDFRRKNRGVFVHVLRLNVSLGNMRVMRSIEAVMLNDEENVE